MTIKVDTKGAEMKVRMMSKIHAAAGRQLTHFAGQLIKQAQRNATGGIVGKYKWGRKTGALGRNVGQMLKRRSSSFELTVGTGVGTGKTSVKYARILEKGGIIRPRKAKYLAVPMPDGSIRLCKQVKIPKFQWFSRSVDQKMPLLRQLMRKSTLLSVAKKMGV